MPALALHRVSCRFPGATSPAIVDVDFRVDAGEIVAVMGHTGAGKSTLLKCLTGIVPAYEHAEVTGERWAFGEPLEKCHPGELADRVGIVFQDFEAQLFSTNVELEVGFAPQQLGVPREEILVRTRRALREVGLDGFAARDPATLSGGEKQRLALAGILALEPRVIVLDEPTTDIDPEGKRDVLDLLRLLRSGGAAVVVVEHEVLAAESADRLVLLAEGRVRAEGPSATLLGDVDLLETCGVRPRDLDVVARRLGVGSSLPDVDAAERELRRRGFGARAEGARPDRAERGRGGGDASRSNDPGDPAASHAGGAPEAASAGLLVLEDVCFVYPEGAAALRDVSLRIARGEFVALIGQNGSGKTTLAKQLNGLLRPTSGRVLFEGVDAGTLSLGRLARRVGFVFQDPDHQLFCPSVVDEVAFGPRHLGLPPAELAQRVERCLEVCGLAGRRDEDPFLLPKGERQRLALASILALEPDILILDEPTTGLDHREQRAVLGLLAELNRAGKTVIVITHSPWLVAEYARRVVLLAGGRIRFDGGIRALFRATAELRAVAFVLPDATQLGLRFGIAARTPVELASLLVAGAGGET